MDDRRFDTLTKALAGRALPRRRLTRAVAMGALALALSGAPEGWFGIRPAAAGGCRKERKRCKRDQQCCSGICRKRRCRLAPNQFSCSISKNTCEAGPGDDAGCGTTNGGDPCSCVITTTGASFCGSIADIDCVPCIDSDDCAAVSGPGSACIRAVGACLCNSGEETFCIPPCISDAVEG